MNKYDTNTDNKQKSIETDLQEYIQFDFRGLVNNHIKTNDQTYNKLNTYELEIELMYNSSIKAEISNIEVRLGRILNMDEYEIMYNMIIDSILEHYEVRHG